MELCLRAKDEAGLSDDELRAGLLVLLSKHPAKKVLILPPDFSRFHSKAGFLTRVCFEYYTGQGLVVDILPTLGTHRAMTRAEANDMFGEIPFERFFAHNWRTDVVKIGEVPGGVMGAFTDGLWTEPIAVEVNRMLMDESYDLILSPGQVVPHEVIGMANHAKNVFIGAGGAEMINKSHMLGAIYGMERVMGRDYSPVRKVFDYALERFFCKRPILFLLTVTTAPEGKTLTHGLFCGRERDALTAAVALSQHKNIDFVPRGIQKCVVYLDPNEFHSTWLGNKAIYRTRMAVADDGELLILAPGVEIFGEDRQVDALIRKYGYCGRKQVLELLQDPACADLRENRSAAAHLIHGSSDGRFRVTYAVSDEMCAQIERVGYASADISEQLRRYDPNTLQYGYNTLPSGEEIFFIPNPALGLWIDRARFEREGGSL
ncbi:MAG: lactate racemase domain-containing protein [Eubacteriales bacterium]|jgi:nickel-dependent lactate racemase|nr:lactate racemase domain-containing protein [Eubacteriales bacterium]